MFVRESTYLAEVRRRRAAESSLMYTNRQLQTLRNEMDELVRRINAKGGEAFLRYGTLQPQQQTHFTKDEVTKMLMLCHPDKHGGKQSATDMTAKLLKLREEL